MRLNQLADNPGARKVRKRIGRGLGSGKAQTGGRGIKGQKSRSGVAIKGFEGGQMPIHMRLPKRGFNAINPKEFTVINLGRLQTAIDAGKVDAGAPITAESLVAAGVVRRKKDGVRILGTGQISAKVTLEVAGASKTAIAAVEKAGGSVKVLEVAKPVGKPKKKAKAKKAKAGEGDES